MKQQKTDDHAPMGDGQVCPWHCFIGIDWSGAKGALHQGIQLAIAQTGRDAPIGISASDSAEWSR